MCTKITHADIGHMIHYTYSSLRKWSYLNHQAVVLSNNKPDRDGLDMCNVNMTVIRANGSEVIKQLTDWRHASSVSCEHRVASISCCCSRRCSRCLGRDVLSSSAGSDLSLPPPWTCQAQHHPTTHALLLVNQPSSLDLLNLLNQTYISHQNIVQKFQNISQVQ